VQNVDEIVWQVSISPTFYEQLFPAKVFFETFIYLQFGFVIFWKNNIGAKSAHKLLVKLTIGCTQTSMIDDKSHCDNNSCDNRTSSSMIVTYSNCTCLKKNLMKILFKHRFSGYDCLSFLPSPLCLCLSFSHTRTLFTIFLILSCLSCLCLALF